MSVPQHRLSRFSLTFWLSTIKENCDKKNLDGIELHSSFLQIVMDFDGNQPISVQFRFDIICLPKKKHMVKKDGKAEKRPWAQIIWTNELIEFIELFEAS